MTIEVDPEVLHRMGHGRRVFDHISGRGYIQRLFELGGIGIKLVPAGTEEDEENWYTVEDLAEQIRMLADVLEKLERCR